MDLLGETKRLSNIELFSEMALLGYFTDAPGSKAALTFLTGAKIVKEMYARITEKDRIIDGLRADAIQKITNYVQKNPRASPDDQAREIKKHMDDFAAKVAIVNHMP